MKIKEVHAGIKITKNYNSYQISLTAEIETGENPEIIGAELMEKALDIVKKKTGIDPETSKDTQDDAKPIINKKEDRNKGIEVGAAWPDKKSENILNVKDSRTGKWKSININELEKTDKGYKYKTNEGIFILRKLQEEERINDRMPQYRIYKIEE